jgi:hypothetical protein
MRLMMIFLVALPSCARSVAATRTLEPSSLPCLDGQGQRELLAGFERVIGKEKARASECCAKADERWGLFGYGLLGGSAATAIVVLIALIGGGTWTR